MVKVDNSKLVKLLDLISDLIVDEFNGNIQINFKDGDIKNINKIESILLDK
jgi:hypothetical protein